MSISNQPHTDLEIGDRVQLHIRGLSESGQLGRVEKSEYRQYTSEQGETALVQRVKVHGRWRWRFQVVAMPTPSDIKKITQGWLREHLAEKRALR